MGDEGEPDGTPLGRGLVLSRAGGSRVPAYRCACGREQTATYAEGGFGGDDAAARGAALALARWAHGVLAGPSVIAVRRPLPLTADDVAALWDARMPPGGG